MRDERIAQAAFFLSGFQVREETKTVTVGTAAVQVLAENSKRMFMTLVNTTGATVFLWRDATVSTAIGIPLLPGSALSLSFLEDGNKVARQWWAISGTAAQSLWCYIEVSENEPAPGQVG